MDGGPITLSKLQKSLRRMENMRNDEFKGLDTTFRNKNLRKIFYDKDKDTPCTSRGFLYRKTWSPLNLDKIDLDATDTSVPTTPLVICNHEPKCSSKEECMKRTKEGKESDDPK